MTAPRSGPPARIRRAEAADAPVIAGLTEDSSIEPWSVMAVAQVLCLPGSWGLLALGLEAEPAGFLIGRSAGDESEIVNIVVAKNARRQGVGRALLDAAIEAARETGAATQFLEVASDNRAARILYEAGRFRVVGRRPGYYRRPGGDWVDALIMRRAIVN